MVRTVPLPAAGEALLTRPGPDEVHRIAQACVTCLGGTGALTPLQVTLLRAVFAALTGHDVTEDVVARDPAPVPDGATAAERLGQVLHRRNLVFRERVLQTLLLVAMVADPLQEAVAARICAAAAGLGVDDDMIAVARAQADGARALALADFDRSGYAGEWSASRARVLHTFDDLSRPWQAVENDPALAGRWRSLEGCPEGSLGLAVWRFYRARGFRFPGEPGSAPPYLAQHDWVHALADYGSTLESELEVFGFIARATDDPKGFSLLAMVVGLFETGFVERGAGLFEAAPGHLRERGGPVRLADAMRRGALTDGDQRLLDRDWFADADRSLDDVRAEIGLVPKAAEAVAAGSVGPFDPGSLSPFQDRAGRALAAECGRPYDSWGATVHSNPATPQKA